MTATASTSASRRRVTASCTTRATCAPTAWPAPKEWDDLKKPIYFGHVGISAPSRSGTTHLTVETILQGEGWEKGWATLLEIGGNLAQVSDRSFGVPDAVNSGQYGIGIVIDFFGLSAKASGFPVEFVYPTVTTIVPANVGIIANARNQKAAEAFVEFLLSEEGQQILLDPKIQRLPVRLATYDKAPAGYPIRSRTPSWAPRSASIRNCRKARYELLNSLYDRVVTFRLKELNAAWKAIHDAEGKLGARRRRRGQAAHCRGAQARGQRAGQRAGGERQGDRRAPSRRSSRAQKPAGRQAEFESRWDAAAVKNYAEAKALAEKALTAKYHPSPLTGLFAR